MTVLNQARAHLAAARVSPEHIDQASNMVNELTYLKAVIETAELRFNSSRSATQRKARLAIMKDLNQKQTDVSIDLAELLNLPV